MLSTHQDSPTGVVTHLLQQAARREPGAEHRLWDQVFPVCLTLAEDLLRRDRLGRHLHPRDLVSLAFLKLTGDQLPQCPNRKSFYAIATRAMRQAMIETARKLMGRNGDHPMPLPAEHLAELPDGATWQPADVLALEEALVALAREAPRTARVLELRFYSHLQVGEIAAMLGVSRRTATQELHDALVWLGQRLGGHGR